eukprot:16438341-Heterocapsa_arctica.AAC.2
MQDLLAGRVVERPLPPDVRLPTGGSSPSSLCSVEPRQRPPAPQSERACGPRPTPGGGPDLSRALSLGLCGPSSPGSWTRPCTPPAACTRGGLTWLSCH